MVADERCSRKSPRLSPRKAARSQARLLSHLLAKAVELRGLLAGDRHRSGSWGASSPDVHNPDDGPDTHDQRKIRHDPGQAVKPGRRGSCQYRGAILLDEPVQNALIIVSTYLGDELASHAGRVGAAN